MQFTDGSTVPFRDPGTQHREGTIRFRYLLKGQEDSPQNYELSVVQTEGRFFSPAHRHNFDQIRWILSGSFGEPGRLMLREGEAGYYPEATPYKIDSGDSEVLLLQFGGASGNGFTHYDQLRAFYPVLAEKGEFQDGIFRWHTPPAGTAKQQDGYEALWEAIHQRPLRYPKARYRQPTVMSPEAFSWIPEATSPLLSRELGRFTERAITVAQLRLAGGDDAQLSSPHTTRLFYVLSGRGKVDSRPLHPGCAFELLQGTRAHLQAEDTLTLVDLHLPRFNDRLQQHANPVRHEEALA